MPTPTRSSSGLTAVGEVEVQGPGVACGVLLPNADPERLGHGGSDGDLVMQAARLAEQLEFESVWAGDHLTCPAPALDALTCIAASAAVTERIALGCSVMPSGLRNMAWTAKKLASIDLLAGGGRLRLGVGAEFPAELEAADAPVSEPDTLLDDSLAVIGDLLGGRPVDFAGRTLTVRAPGLEPALPALPPIYVGGRGEPALRRAARSGDAWMPIWLTPARIAERSQLLGEMALELGRATPRIAPLILIRVDDDRDHAYAQARAHLAGQYRIELEAIDRWTLLDSIDGAVEHLHQFVELGVSEILLLTLGADPLQQYERLAEVRARLKAPAATSGTAP